IYAGLNIQDSAEKYFAEYMKLNEKIKLGFDIPEPLDLNGYELEKDKIEPSRVENLKNSLTITWIIAIVIISGLIIFIYLLMAMLISRRKQRKKFHPRTNL
ncbi:MAG: hypothetical protein IH598_05060, partial [Bacteroidales bacterium]|nr:hypothetical protein [Bacteroidales bacterium]